MRIDFNYIFYASTSYGQFVQLFPISYPKKVLIWKNTVYNVNFQLVTLTNTRKCRTSINVYETSSQKLAVN